MDMCHTCYLDTGVSSRSCVIINGDALIHSLVFCIKAYGKALNIYGGNVAKSILTTPRNTEVSPRPPIRRAAFDFRADNSCQHDLSTLSQAQLVERCYVLLDLAVVIGKTLRVVMGYRLLLQLFRQLAGRLPQVQAGYFTMLSEL